MDALPRFDRLGPDPEPPGLRIDAVLERIAQDARRRRAEQPSSPCPLASATGKASPCRQGRCPYYRVPGAYLACAVDQWSPRARREPRIAAWFISRREEIQRGQSIPPGVAPPRARG